MRSTDRPSPALRKSLGQHHLTRGEVCRPLVDFLQPAGRRVVEIGPGGGVLTRQLQAAGGEVLALELDFAWAFHLRERDPGDGLRLVVGDALEFPWERLPPGTLVTGNLPYNVATAIVQAVARHPERVPRAAFLLQREVAERLAARPGERPYGALSVLVQARARVRLLGRVRPGAFRPPPKVDSAFVGLELHPPPLPESQMADFERLVHAGFGQRRKTLRNALANFDGRQRAAQLLAAAGIDPAARAEQLGLDRWLELYRSTGPTPVGGRVSVTSRGPDKRS